MHLHPTNYCVSCVLYSFLLYCFVAKVAPEASRVTVGLVAASASVLSENKDLGFADKIKGLTSCTSVIGKIMTANLFFSSLWISLFCSFGIGFAVVSLTIFCNEKVAFALNV